MVEQNRRRRTRRETKSLMLQAGAELAVEFVTDDADGREPLPHIRVADVAVRATEIVRRSDPNAGEITTGSIYPIWPDQASYQAELVTHILDSDHLGVAPDWNDLADYLEHTDDDIHTAVARFAARGWEHARTNARLLVVLSQMTQTRPGDLKSELVEHYGRVWEQLVPAFQLICGRFDYQLRPGGSFQDFVRAAIALMDGLTMQYQIEQAELERSDSRYRDLRGAEWTFVGQATAALFDGWFEPAPR